MKKSVSEFKNRNVPFIIVHNKSDIEPVSRFKNKLEQNYHVPVIGALLKILICSH